MNAHSHTHARVCMCGNVFLFLIMFYHTTILMRVFNYKIKVGKLVFLKKKKYICINVFYI